MQYRNPITMQYCTDRSDRFAPTLSSLAVKQSGPIEFDQLRLHRNFSRISIHTIESSSLHPGIKKDGPSGLPLA